jgi:general secretion pathway protein C
MAARWFAFLIWGLVLATAAGWVLQLSTRSRLAPAHAVVVDAAAALRSDFTKVLGRGAVAEVADARPVAADARYKLLGVIASAVSGDARDSLALISVDGKPARAFRPGAAVDGALVLLSVNPRGAALGPSGAAATVSLNLTPPPPAATGTPGQAAAPAAAAAPAPAPAPGQAPPAVVPAMSAPAVMPVPAATGAQNPAAAPAAVPAVEPREVPVLTQPAGAPPVSAEN